MLLYRLLHHDGLVHHILGSMRSNLAGHELRESGLLVSGLVRMGELRRIMWYKGMVVSIGRLVRKLRGLLVLIHDGLVLGCWRRELMGKRLLVLVRSPMIVR